MSDKMNTIWIIVIVVVILLLLVGLAIFFMRPSTPVVVGQKESRMQKTVDTLRTMMSGQRVEMPRGADMLAPRPHNFIRMNGERRIV